jgi:hypothetical protein
VAVADLVGFVGCCTSVLYAIVSADRGLGGVTSGGLKPELFH